jgi:homoserine O-acetyltransferase
LAFGERYPERVGQLVVICAADRPHPMATAWRSVQRRMVRFAAECGRAKEGLQLARALAMSTYRSPEEFAARFDGVPTRVGGGLGAVGAPGAVGGPSAVGALSGFGGGSGLGGVGGGGADEHFVFPVEQYLFARGSDYAARYKPESFLCLSESIDLHHVDATRIFVPTTAVAIREDQLVPLADMRGLVARLPVGRLHEISSIYGHDAFLKESDQLRGIFAAALGSVA